MTIEAQEFGNSQAGLWPAPDQEEIEQAPVVEVAVSALSVAGSPRMSGEDAEHVRALAAVFHELPPVIVHRSTMRVIDGVHRLRAAELRGHKRIAVRFFSGDEADAFVLAVKSNVAHGLPLSLADRKTAAVRIIALRPQWSDRLIASVAGLAPGTIAEARKEHFGSVPSGSSRIGQDGRLRPINGHAGRLLASELIRRNPEMSLRQIAKAAGISPETARDVRNRMQRGENPLPRQHQSRQVGRSHQPERRPVGQGASLGLARLPSDNPAAVIERLRADPALRFTETGRTLLRLLHIQLIETAEWKKIGENVPPHCSGIVAGLARECAYMWQQFAEQVEHKVDRVISGA